MGDIVGIILSTDSSVSIYGLAMPIVSRVTNFTELSVS
jgi:hypothetical protein